MHTPEKMSLDLWNQVFLDYLCLECSNENGKAHQHKCGKTLSGQPAAISIHTNLFSDCAGQGRVIWIAVPYCQDCEERPAGSGCIHV